jgi:TolA-binding protein
VDFTTTFRVLISRCLLGLIFLSFLAPAAYPADSEDAQIFITGFNAYQKKDYQGAVDSMSLVLQKYPDTPLRDMAVFWLARSHYKRGNRPEAAKQMARFFREYPDSPLKGTAGPGL